MKTFALALIATLSAASLTERRQHQVRRMHMKSIEDQAEDLAREIQQAAEEAPGEFERAVQDFVEELQCLWAHFEPYEQCIKDLRWEWADECWSRDGYWYYDWETDECEYDYEYEAAEQCWNEGLQYDWETSQCLTWEEYVVLEEARCADYGDEYLWNADWQYCEWIAYDEDDWAANAVNLLRKRASSERQMKKFVMNTYTLDLDLTALEAIEAPLEAHEQAGEELAEQVYGDIAAAVEPHVGSIEEWVVKNAELEAQAQAELYDLLTQSIAIDGVPLSEYFATEEEWIALYKKTGNARKTIMQATDGEASEEITQVSITYYGLSPEEYDWYFQDLVGRIESIGEAVGEELEWFAEAQEELERELEDRLEPIGWELEDLVYETGSDLKTEIYDYVEVETSLATKHQQAASDKSYVAAGVTFGVVGVIAAAGVVVALNKKKGVHSTEEALL